MVCLLFLAKLARLTLPSKENYCSVYRSSIIIYYLKYIYSAKLIESVCNCVTDLLSLE
jgi:hypothetical protein